MKKLCEACLSKKRGKAEIIAFVLYIAAVSVVSCFHEPWFDEVQAWEIARCCSLKELLFEVPHYEGHPPLWHLILYVFAKTGIPFKATLKIVNITFASLAVSLILFKSPFPKIIRCTLPFSFFFFYQYGVVSRPYSAMMLAVFLAAITYKNRNAHPWKYIFSLTFLSFTSALGLLLAGSLCAVWSIQIISGLVRKRNFSCILKDKRIHSLFFILAAAIIMILMIYPADDCYYSGYVSKISVVIKEPMNTALFIAMPFDSIIGCLLTYSGGYPQASAAVISAVCGALCWFFLITLTAKNKKLSEFLLMYVPYNFYFAYRYSSAHHIGISMMIIVFIMWIMADQEGSIKLPGYIITLDKNLKSKFIRKITAGAVAVMYCMGIVYSVVSSVQDIRKPYGPEQLAEFIKENHLENRKIMASWDALYDSEDTGEYMFSYAAMPSKHKRVKTHQTNIMGLATVTCAYFDRNIFMNLNVDDSSDFYVHHRWTEDTETVMKKWAEKGLPEFIISYAFLDDVYSEEQLKDVIYVCIKQFDVNYFFKLDDANGKINVYMRSDLLDEYPQFEPLFDPILVGLKLNR